ncbi:YqiJ family protein [Acinetobacter sp. Ver3]|uniref:YqiJ family protein n=1 Tax=Acinetobacter sp. Ver3 TaxID=466088 RepID=UPI0004524507|nr:YqiJ family protein [Acinetobacter sp. Ver3]EZQ01101.1 membrane protein [Acinetobacter sp. Ver3]
MWDMFINPSNLFFSISICLMFFIGILEVFLLITGLSSQGFLEQFLPSSLDSSPEMIVDHQSSIWIQFLDWLYLGRIPVLIWLIIFLTTFSIVGFLAQSIIHHVFGSFLTVWLITPLVLVVCMPFVRLFSRWIVKIIPKDETTAIHSDDLIGLRAEIILGTARLHYPAQAKLKDRFGQTHYILVEPEADEIFVQGQQVLLTQRSFKGFQAISQ